MNLDEMPPRLRRAAVAALASQLDGAERARRGRRVPSDTNRPERNPRATPASGGSTPRYRCATCGATFMPWAPAERHADEHGGARIELARVGL